MDSRAFRLVKRTHNTQHLTQKEEQCVKLRGQVGEIFVTERTASVGEVWSIITNFKRIRGERWEWKNPVLTSKETSLSNKEKTEIMTKSSTKIHSLGDVAEGRKTKTENLLEHLQCLEMSFK